jgi:hypothetical protein
MYPVLLSGYSRKYCPNNPEYALCVYFGNIEQSEAEDIFDRINSQLTYPTQDTFDDQYRKAMRRFSRNGWERYLGITSVR